MRSLFAWNSSEFDCPHNLLNTCAPQTTRQTQNRTCTKSAPPPICSALVAPPAGGSTVFLLNADESITNGAEIAAMAPPSKAAVFSAKVQLENETEAPSA